MKYLIAFLFVAAFAEAQVGKKIKPMALGRLDTMSGILKSSTGDCPPSLGGDLVEVCFVISKCQDTTCNQSMSDNDSVPGADPGGKLIAIYPVDWCDSDRSTKQDSIFLWLRGRLFDNQRTCLDSIRAGVNSHQDTSGCFISSYDQFTAEDMIKIAARKPMIDSLTSPIAFWKYTCEEE